jgi:hypothetical protein
MDGDGLADERANARSAHGAQHARVDAWLAERRF